MDECLEHPWLKDDSDIPAAIVGLGFDTAEANSEDEVDSDASNASSGERPTNGVNGHNGVNLVNGVNGCNGSNGTHEEDKGE